MQLKLLLMKEKDFMNHNKMMSTTIGISGMGPRGGEVILPVMVLSHIFSTVHFQGF